MRVSGATKEVYAIELFQRRWIADPLQQLPLRDKVDVLVVGEQVIDDSEEASSVVFTVEPSRVVVQAKRSSVAEKKC